MKNLLEPEGVTEKELQTYVASLQESAKKDVRTLLDSGAGEAEVAEYMVSLQREPDDEIGPPEGQPPPRMEKKSHPPEGQPPPRMEKKSHPPGVQGANTGYWQARGVTRAGAKRSKRP